MPIIRRNQVPANLWQSIKPSKSLGHFENAVIQFHFHHRTPIRHWPHVLGRKINLRKLYISVIKRGGYKKVNENDLWDEVLVDLNLPKYAINSELALQSIYHRYLEDFERNQWNILGSNDASKNNSLILELASRDRSGLASFVSENSPKVYSDYQHFVSNYARTESGLSCDLRQRIEFSHLTMSLKSGLPNEIDFALNTLLIMSHNSRISLDLRFTGDLLDLIVAVTGVVHISTFYDQFKSCLWMQNCLKFWHKTVDDGFGRIFLVPNVFTCSKSEVRQLQRHCNSTSNTEFRDLFNDDNQYHWLVDPCCQRIHLVATIIFNLAIDSLNNCQVIVSSNQALRFLLMSVHSRDSVLRRLALNTLTKLRFVLFPIQDEPERGLNTLHCSAELSVDIDTSNTKEEDSSDFEWFTEFLLNFLMSLLSSENRCDRISAYEMLKSLCLIEENHETLSKHLQNQFITRITSQLLIPDIHPLCGALEALVALSQLGEDMCRRMAMCKPLLSSLLQFVNIEAQMFGPSAVYKIKTFNSRPPIPAVNFHSLRMPVQNSFRPITPFGHSTVPNIPNSNPSIINSIASQSLSKSFVDPTIPQTPNNIFFNTNSTSQHNSITNLPQDRLHLTPLQQIDHLLIKSIASFSTPSSSFLNIHEENPSKNAMDIPNSKIENSEERSGNEKVERRIVKIKCVVEGVDLDIEDLNGATKRALDNVNINGFSSEEHQQELKEELEKDDKNVSLDNEHDKNCTAELDVQSCNECSFDEKDHNGTLELDVTCDDDSDRRQMPPPALPTPSMLKKQMRAKFSPQQMTTGTNGYVHETELEERCEHVKEWLMANFQLTDDFKHFVTKKQLVDELHAMEESMESAKPGHKVALSAQELHICIKEIFGHKVQVKVSHGVNGNSQLIYCHLGRIGTGKLVPNGVVTSEINGFVNHATEGRTCLSNVDIEIRESNDSEENNAELTSSKTNIFDMGPLRKKLCHWRNRPRDVILKKLKKKYQSLKKKSFPVSRFPRSLIRTVKETAAYFDPSLTISHTKDENNTALRVSCLWCDCSRRFIDENTLQTHITNDHLSVTTTSTVTSPTRWRCQWRECATSYVPRAPLSLLSHVIQEHCVVPTTVGITPSPVSLMSPSSINQPSFNTMVPSNMRLSSEMSHHSQLLEKSGWSVLYDHFRLDEQMHGNLPEGPITKHIRISSAIVLRNMSRHSILAKEFLRSHEHYLSTVALSSQDCSSIIVQCLDQLSPLLTSPLSSPTSTIMMTDLDCDMS